MNHMEHHQSTYSQLPAFNTTENPNRNLMPHCASLLSGQETRRINPISDDPTRHSRHCVVARWEKVAAALVACLAHSVDSADDFL